MSQSLSFHFHQSHPIFGQKQPNMIKAFVQAVLEHLFNTDTGDTVLSLFGGMSSSILISNHAFVPDLALRCLTWIAAGIFGALGALLAKYIVKRITNHFIKSKNNENKKG